LELYLVFYSTHHLLRAEKALRGANLVCRLVPIPRQITSDCGMAVSFAEEDLERVQILLDRLGVAHSGIYRIGPEGVEKLR